MAEYLEFVRTILEKRENATVLPDETVFHLNEKQCIRLWHTIRKIYDYFSKVCSYLQSKGHKYLFANIFQDFYIIVTRVDTIANQFSDEHHWLQAAIFQGNHRQTFEELTKYLQTCVTTFTESIEDLIPAEHFDRIWNQDDMVDSNIINVDAANLRKKLRNLLAQPDLNEEKRLLAQYLSERQDGQDEDPPQFYAVDAGYPILGEHIGHGSNASVYKVTWLGVACAKKYFDANEDEELTKEFVKEASILAKLNHPHILKMLCTSVKPEVSLVMEFMPMSLFDFIRQRRKLKMPSTFLAKMDMILQIAVGMGYLHDQRVAHRDLKSSNILVAPFSNEKLRDEGYVDVKLADMGLDEMKIHASTSSNLTDAKSRRRTWLAPELCKEFLSELAACDKNVKIRELGLAEIFSGTRSKKIVWEKVDIYCFAMTCFEILSGERPFKYYERSHILHSQILIDETPKLPSSCPEELVSLLEACWDSEPDRRPSFKDITETLTTIKRSFLEPDHALEYLELTRMIIEQRGKVSASQTFLQLNDHQSTQLWQNIKTIHSAFSSWFMGFSKAVQNKCVPFFKELYVIVTRANAIVQCFDHQRPWLEAVIVQGDHRQAFKELTFDLQECALVFHNFAKSQCNTIDLHCDASLSHLSVGDYQIDATNIGSTLQKLITEYILTEEETHLAKYVIEREKLSMSSLSIKDADRELPSYYTYTSGYPTQILAPISRGSTGSVCKVEYLGMICAQKYLDAPKDENLMKAVIKEVKALAKLNHPHIVKLFSMNETGEHISFVMEIMPMSLAAFIQERWRNPEGMAPFTMLSAIDVMLQIARGMEYSHGQDIVHRDIKSTNILVAPSNNYMLRSEGYGFVKLTDLGSAKMQVCASTYPTYKMMGTTNWRAPEAFQQSEAEKMKINWKKADVFSFGLTCSEILTGEIPFHSGEISNLHARMKNGERPVLPSTCPKDLASLLEACWDFNPTVRPSFTEITKKLICIKRSLLYQGLNYKPLSLRVRLKNHIVDSCRMITKKYYSPIVNTLYSFIYYMFLFFIFYVLWIKVGNTTYFCVFFYFLGLRKGRRNNSIH